MGTEEPSEDRWGLHSPLAMSCRKGETGTRCLALFLSFLMHSPSRDIWHELSQSPAEIQFKKLVFVEDAKDSWQATAAARWEAGE